MHEEISGYWLILCLRQVEAETWRSKLWEVMFAFLRSQKLLLDCINRQQEIFRLIGSGESTGLVIFDFPDKVVSANSAAVVVCTAIVLILFSEACASGTNFSITPAKTRVLVMISLLALLASSRTA